jgi:hypothetical protein
MKKVILPLVMLACFLGVSCSKENAKKLILDKVSTQLYQSETALISSNGTNVKYESRDPYVAGVDENGEVTARFVGETIIDVKADEGSAEFKVTVNGKYHTFDEPCHDWTKTKSQVFAMHPSLSFSQSGDYWMATVDESKAMILQYKFNTSDKLESAALSIHQDYAIQAMYFLAERYLPITEKDGYYFFVNGLSTSTANTSVALTKITGYKAYMIMYLPYSSSKAGDIVDVSTLAITLPESWKE